MKYINQLLYENMPYPTDVKNPDSPMKNGNIKRAGCGLCCLCMVVDRLTTQSLPLEEGGIFLSSIRQTSTLEQI